MNFEFAPNGAPAHEEEAMVRLFTEYLQSVLQEGDMSGYLQEDHAIHYDQATKVWTWWSGASNGFTQQFVWLSPVRPWHMAMTEGVEFTNLAGSTRMIDSESGENFGFTFFKEPGVPPTPEATMYPENNA